MGVIRVKITSHHRLNDLVAVLSRIITIIFIVMNVICYIFECLGAKLHLLMKALRYVVRHNMPCCDGDFLPVAVVVI